MNIIVDYESDCVRKSVADISRNFKKLPEKFRSFEIFMATARIYPL